MMIRIQSCVSMMKIALTNEADEDLISMISQICVWSTTFARGADSSGEGDIFLNRFDVSGNASSILRGEKGN